MESSGLLEVREDGPTVRIQNMRLHSRLHDLNGITHKRTETPTTRTSQDALAHRNWIISGVEAIENG